MRPEIWYPGMVERGHWVERPKPGHPGVIEREWISESDQRTRRARPPSGFHYQRIQRSGRSASSASAAPARRQTASKAAGATKGTSKKRPDWYLETPEPVELRADRAPEITITLRSSVRDALFAYARESSDGLETAGFLFGESIRSWHKKVSVGWVTRMVKDRREGSASFDIEALVAEKGQLRRMESKMEEIGSWHTHPTTSGTPSEEDLQTWLNGHDFLERAFYFGLILTAKPQRELWSSDVHAWVVRRTGASQRPVCDLAKVVFS